MEVRKGGGAVFNVGLSVYMRFDTFRYYCVRVMCADIRPFFYSYPTTPGAPVSVLHWFFTPDMYTFDRWQRVSQSRCVFGAAPCHPSCNLSQE